MMIPFNIPLTLAADAAAPASGFWRWLLGLHKLDPRDPRVVLSWTYAVPAWAWAMIVIGCVIVAWLSYRKLLGWRGGRLVAAGVRGLIVLAIAILLARPLLVLPDEEKEVDHVLMLVDRSASGAVRDAHDADHADQRISRNQQLTQMIGGAPALWTELAKSHNLDWYGFSEQLEPLTDPAKLAEPTGRATAMRSAIDESLRRTAGRPISAIVVWSDGRSTEPIGAEMWQRLTQLAAPVYVVPLGDANAPRDLALQRVDAPDRAFVKDAVPVTVTVGQTGEESRGPAPAGTLVKLIDQTTGKVLDTKPVTNLGEPVRLVTSSDAAGPATWRVQLVTPTPEIVEQNNTQLVELTLIDRPIRVLYVEGYPRWEYRYLKSLLVREKSVSSSIMLVSADRTFAQEGTIPLRRLPRTDVEMEMYDVIVIGDVPAAFFSAGELRLIYEQVSTRGAGLLWIAGSHDMPVTYAASALAPLLPMVNAAAWTPVPPPVKLKPTPIAESLGLLKLRAADGGSSGSADESTAWPNLPPLFWAQGVGPLKPAVEVLAADEKTQSPLIARMRYGAGQSMYIATDEIWRWRYGKGDLYFEQFWMQMLRLMARGRLQSGSEAGERARFTVSSRRAAAGDTLVVELQIRDQTLLEKLPTSVDVAVTPVADSAAPGSATQRVDEAAAQSLSLTATDTPGLYRATWSPRVPGKMALRLSTPTLADLGLQQAVLVERSDDELRQPASNHPLLIDLATHTGGKVLTAATLDQLKQLPHTTRTTPRDISEPLWKSPLAFALLLLLLTAEWIGRKMLGLA